MPLFQIVTIITAYIPSWRYGLDSWLTKIKIKNVSKNSSHQQELLHQLSQYHNYILHQSGIFNYTNLLHFCELGLLPLLPRQYTRLPHNRGSSIRMESASIERSQIIQSSNTTVKYCHASCFPNTSIRYKNVPPNKLELGWVQKVSWRDNSLSFSLVNDLSAGDATTTFKDKETDKNKCDLVQFELVSGWRSESLSPENHQTSRCWTPRHLWSVQQSNISPRWRELGQSQKCATKTYSSLSMTSRR